MSKWIRRALGALPWTAALVAAAVAVAVGASAWTGRGSIRELWWLTPLVQGHGYVMADRILADDWLPWDAWQPPDLVGRHWRVQTCKVDPADGQCWVADADRKATAHCRPIGFLYEPGFSATPSFRGVTISTPVAVAALWAPCVALAVRHGLRRRLSRAGRCPGCGYDLRASPGLCPECGRPPTPIAA